MKDNTPPRPFWLGLVGLAWLIGCSGQPTRYQLAHPELFANQGAADRHCVYRDRNPPWQPGRLTSLTCSAWNRRGDFDAVPGQWLFFPNMALGSTTRGISRCPDCRLEVDVQGRGEDARWSVELTGPGDKVPIARYQGGVAGGLFDGEGQLDLHRAASCTGYCKDLFVAEGRLADQITVGGRFTDGVLTVTAPFNLSYAIGDEVFYAGQGSHDPARGVVPDGEGKRSQGEKVYQLGTWRMGKLHGQGTERRADGLSYEGSYADGVFDGRGVLSLPDGERYEGQFKAGERHGEGIQTLADGERYAGAFSHDQRQGRGVLQTVDGGRYEGDFLRGRRHGDGAQRHKDGSSYEGQWRDGQRHGTGRFTDPDGLVYEGQWEADHLVPDDVQILWRSGPYERYAGPLLEGRPHGEGTLSWRDGLSYVGTFLHGRMAGQGVLAWPDGHEYIGQFSEGRPDGCGLHRGPDGIAWAGTWSAGAPLALGCALRPTALAGGQRAGEGSSFPADVLRDALRAQRGAAARRRAQAGISAVLAHHRVVDPGRAPRKTRRVALGFSWPTGPLRRLLHPSCVPPEGLSLTTDGQAITPTLWGQLDLEAVIHLPEGSTSQICAEIEGPCGRGAGCVPADIPSDNNAAPTRLRILLSVPKGEHPDETGPPAPNGPAAPSLTP